MRTVLKKTPGRLTGSAVVLLPALAITFLILALLWSAGCTPNDPFDPDSVANRPPVVKMSISSIDGSDLNSTSYFQRTFSWFGSDTDGWVQRYFISIRLEASVDAPWDTTTSTDTTMTFTTDDQGNAEATFLIVCQDDRGALSDTFVQFVPLKNFPPAMNFQSDFDPLVNMQREIDTSGATPDTTFWNWGATNFRMFALDLDGSETMDDFYDYTVAAIEPTETYDIDDPLADPLTTWVRAPYPNSDEVREFEVFVNNVPPGITTFRVKTSDESNSTVELAYTWEVRAPSSSVLFIRDNSSSIGRALYNEYLDGRYGPGNWDLYDFWLGYPDNNFVLLESMRKFEAVMWADGGVTSDLLKAATARDAAMESYLDPADGSAPGRLLLISKAITGSTSGISAAFRQNTMGLNPTGSPAPALSLPAGKMALGLVAGLPALTSTASSARGIGLRLLAGTEGLYQMEYCLGCYTPRNEPFDPIVAARRPLRTD
ncbi:MAG: hypothetical protein ACI9UQ_001951, partial [Candidatus Krumholzibacteriia bacterium]